MAGSNNYEEERVWITAEDMARRKERAKCCSLWYWKNLDRMNYVYLVAFSILVIVIVVGAVTAVKESSKPSWDVDRLPTTVQPLSYNITLTPDIEQLNVTGTVDIVTNVTAPAKYLILHAVDMTIDEYSVSSAASNEDVLIKKMIRHEELLVLKPQNKLVPGLYTLRFSFTYDVTGDLAGLYKSTYTTAAGQNRTILTTQMEPLDARKAFPCFDEPGFKAHFTITTYKPVGYIALSNMPPSQDVPRGQEGYVQFQATPLMSTYLVALVICDFESISGSSSISNVPVRVFAPVDQLEDASFALSVATDVLDYYENVFSIPYALPKLDLIAIPDFAAGAMENWGLVTYRETALLFNATQSSASDREWVALVVAHELAHQWFGNLVTMEWWNDLWLNEGFATFMEASGVNSLFPKWDLWGQFPSKVLETARAADSVTGTHALHSPADQVITRNDIAARFDTISYEKGGSVLRMLERVITEDALFQALTLYMNTHKYGNAVSEALWHSIDKSLQGTVPLPYNVTTFMESWTSQPGYPVVSVKAHGKATVSVTQHRFTAPSVTADDSTWILPLTATPLSRRQEDSCSGALHWPPTQDAASYNVTLAACELSGSEDTLLANVDGSAYFRVNYTEGNWQRLTWAVGNSSTSGLSDLDVTMLLNDAFALNFFNLIDYRVPFNLLEAARLSSPHRYSEIVAMMSAVNHLDRLLEEDGESMKLNAYAATLLTDVLANLTTNNIAPREDHVLALLQGSVLDFACRAGAPIKSTVTALFRDFANNGNVPHPDILAAVLSEGVRSGVDGAVDAVWQLYQGTSVAAVRDTCLGALASSRDQDQLNALINEAFTTSGRIRAQDRDIVLRLVARTSHLGADLVWQFIKDNWAEVPSLPRVLSEVASRMATEKEANDLKSTLKSHKDEIDSLSQQVLVEQVRVQSNWRNNNLQGVLSWLEAHA